MTRNQLPDGVGKKIVEALKRQAEADTAPVVQTSNPEPIVSENAVANFDVLENFIVEEENNNTESLDILNSEEIKTVNEILSKQNEQPQSVPQQPQATAPAMESNVAFPTELQDSDFVTVSVMNPDDYLKKTKVNNQSFANTQEQTMPMGNSQNLTFKTPSNINIPANVSILRNLIASLPVGVTKQTGALIIRQTLEAMGIPMTNVLKEAQDVQEELNSSTRECMLKIQEYKSNILQLEQSVKEYQKSITQINDLVSLFILTDK